MATRCRRDRHTLLAEEHRLIQEYFKNMSEADYRYHELKDFFEPRTDKKPRYQAKMIDTGILGQGKETMFDIDHETSCLRAGAASTTRATWW